MTNDELSGRLRLSLDGMEIARLFAKQDAGKNVNGIHALPSGRWFAIAGKEFTIPPLWSNEAAREWYLNKRRGFAANAE
jgi:hypothetical protein